MSERAGTTQPDRMITPRLLRLASIIIEESGTPFRARRVQAVSNPIGSMAVRVDRRHMRDGVTLFVASAFVYDGLDEGVLTVHRHDVYRGDGDHPQVEPFSRRFIIDPAVGSILQRHKDKAEDLEGIREATTVLHGINRARVQHDPFIHENARANMHVVLEAVARNDHPEAYFHPQILESFPLPKES